MAKLAVIVSSHELAANITARAERRETIRAALELAGVPIDNLTRRALNDFALDVERAITDLEEEKD